MSAPESAAVTPGQAAPLGQVYWDAYSGNPLQWKHLGEETRAAAECGAQAVKVAVLAARQPQPAPGGALRERLALLDIIAAISEHDEADVKYPVELLVSIERLAELAIADGEPHACEPLSVKPADDVKPAPELAAAPELRAAMRETSKVQDVVARMLSWFGGDGTRRHAAATRAQLAHAYHDGGLDVPEELRRFL